MCKNALGLDRIYVCSNSGIHEPAWLQGAQPGSPGQVQGDHIHHAFFYVPWNFFPFHGKYFLSSAMENLVSSTIENIFIRQDKFSIWSRLVIWNLDPRVNVVRQEVQYCALRRRWKTLFLIWGWVLMMDWLWWWWWCQPGLPWGLCLYLTAVHWIRNSILSLPS